LTTAETLAHKGNGKKKVVEKRLNLCKTHTETMEIKGSKARKWVENYEKKPRLCEK
jgi:hypothetical protein